MYRDDREATRVRLEALIAKQQAVVGQLRERLVQIDEVRARLIERDQVAGEKPKIDLTPSEVGDIEKLELEGLVVAADEVEARSNELDGELEVVSRLVTELEQRLRGRWEPAPLTPPPRYVPVRYVLAETCRGIGGLMVFSLYFIPILIVPFTSPLAAFITAGVGITLSILISFRRIQMLRWGVRLKTEVVTEDEIYTGTPEQITSGEVPAYAGHRTKLAITGIDGKRHEIVLEGSRYSGDGFLGHARHPEHIFRISDFVSNPTSDHRGRWTGRVGIPAMIMITIVVGYFATLVVLAVLGVELPK